MTDGIVIQARSGSTRLPSKILLPFDGERRIIDILLKKLRRDCPELKIVVATTVNPADDAIEEIARRAGVLCHRGSEDDVLARFIGAGEDFGLDRIIRVCSDNPFLQTGSFAAMLSEHDRAGGDYVAYAFPGGRPTIKSHLGLYAELTTLEALRRAAASTEEKLYREHVTIYLYTHPQEFECRYMPLPELLRKRTDLRLTLDTPSDFKLLHELYVRHRDTTDGSLPALISLIDSNPAYGAIMKENIRQNEK